MMRQSPWLLVFFAAIGIIGLALVGFGSWMLAQAHALGQAQPAPVPQFQPASPDSSGMVIITATLDLPRPIARVTPGPTTAAEAGNPGSTSPTVSGATATPLTPWDACADTYRSNLRSGYRASVSLDPPLPNNVREKADPTSKFLFAIKPGEVVDITAGPLCANGWVWWQIRTASGKTGWTPEGDAKNYWLIAVK